MVKGSRRLAIGLGVVLLFGTTVLGHMALKSAVPAADATISAPPSSLALTFSQKPDPKVSKLDLTGPSGAVTLNNLHVMDNNILMAMIGGQMSDGLYTVAWQSAGDDGHVQKGTYKFTLKRAAQ
jgi:hypothetical protein